MAKQKRALPKRKTRDRARDDQSLLLRSAESLGRMIGSLQRQLDGATKRLALASDSGDAINPPARANKAARRGTTKRGATKKSAGAKNTKRATGAKKKSAARKTRRQ
jgi:hypothetical protein